MNFKSSYYSFILSCLAGYVAINLMVGNGPRWTAITLYWMVVTTKNVFDWDTR